MNETPRSKIAVGSYAIAILGTFLIMAALVWTMRKSTAPAPVAQERAELRRKSLAEVRGADAESLNSYGWVDLAKGVVRLPIDEAVKITEREWQNPAAARSNLVFRAEQAATPPPKPPEKPSQYE